MILKSSQGQSHCALALLDDLHFGYAVFAKEKNADGEQATSLRLEEANLFLAEMLQMSDSEDLIGKTVVELFPEDADRIVMAMADAKANHRCVSWHGDGLVVDKFFSVHIVTMLDGRFLVTLNDAAMLREVEKTNLKHKLLVDSALDIILYIRGDGQIVDANLAACRTYGYTLDELKELSIHDIRHTSMRSLFEEQMWQADAAGVIFESVHVKKDGTTFPVEVSSMGTLILGEKTRIHIIRDISERKAAEARIHHLARYDALTDLLNRGSLLEELELELSRAQREKYRVAVLFIDVDKFKTINDQYGHHVGDLVLRRVAANIRDISRRIDIIGRFGGDEFVAILPLPEGGSPDGFVQRLFDSLASPFKAAGNEAYEFPVQLSVGLSFFPEDGLTADELLKKADQAMYRAKAVTGNSLRE
jgi:diguanylate cyclase (GGDEF)-like protein/PAS domain S-box-containing protein